MNAAFSGFHACNARRLLQCWHEQHRHQPDLRLARLAEAAEIPQSAAFRAWLHERCQARDWDALFDYRRVAPHAVGMRPSDEHLLPWYAAAGTTAAPLRLRDSVTYGSLGMACYAYGPQAERLAHALRSQRPTS